MSEWKRLRYSAAMAATAHDGVGIFRIDVEDRDGKTLGDVGGEA